MTGKDIDMEFEIIEVIDPKPEAMIRQFHCQVCNKTHLQTGKIAIIWVLFQEGYRSQAALSCAAVSLDIPETMV